MSDVAAPDLIQQMGVSAAKLAPPAVVTAYAMVSKGLPFVISFLTLVYLSIQIAHLCWTWIGEWQRKREIRRVAAAGETT